VTDRDRYSVGYDTTARKELDKLDSRSPGASLEQFPRWAPTPDRLVAAAWSATTIYGGYASASIESSTQSRTPS